MFVKLKRYYQATLPHILRFLQMRHIQVALISFGLIYIIINSSLVDWLIELLIGGSIPGTNMSIPYWIMLGGYLIAAWLVFVKLLLPLTDPYESNQDNPKSTPKPSTSQLQITSGSHAARSFQSRTSTKASSATTKRRTTAPRIRRQASHSRAKASAQKP